MKRTHWTTDPIIFCVFASWAVAFVFIKMALSGDGAFSPLAFLWPRMFLSALIMFALLAIMRQPVRIPREHIGKTIVGHNPRFNELWVYLTSRDADEISEYIIWNYEENTWSTGFLSRTSWDEAEIFDYPMATNPIGTVAVPQSELLYHERGYLDKSASRNGNVYVETSPIEIATGETLSVTRRFIQDTRSALVPPSTALQVSFTHALAPEAEQVVEGPYPVDEERGYTDVRFTGRQVQVKFEQVADLNWSIGDYRLEVIAGSGR